MRIAFSIFIFLAMVVSSYANEESKLIKRFAFKGTPIHPGCVRELITELNGDDIVSSVHITRTFLRGCQDSNKYHQEINIKENIVSYEDKEKGIRFGYSLIRELDDSIFLVLTRDAVDGSMGSYSEILIIGLVNDPIYEFTDEGKWDRRLVVKIHKLGSFHPRNLDKFLQAYKLGQISFDRRRD